MTTTKRGAIIQSENPLKAERKGEIIVAIFTLKGARVNAGYSQKAAADELGISNKTLCNWENGVTVPNISYVNALCALYGRKIDEIIFLPDSPLKAD